MLFTSDFGCLHEGVDQCGIIPSIHYENVIAFAVFIALEPLKDFTDVFLGCLVFSTDRNSVRIVPNRDDHRYLKYAGGIDGFKEKAFRGRGVADRTPSDFVSIL
ncbi:MAG: Uncharacterised protein [Cryomorphaceae bacterium]|nr:MAG: Uncharacterised protein [Cryomorphaceae bacterium]